MNMEKCKAEDPKLEGGFYTCGSYAINDHPGSGLCDKCWERKRADELEASAVCLVVAMKKIRGADEPLQPIRDNIDVAIDRIRKVIKKWR